MSVEDIYRYIQNHENFNNPNFLERIFGFAKDKLKLEMVNMNDPIFKEIYGDEVEEDKNYVRKLDKKFENENTEEEKKSKKMATILEAVLYYQIEQNCILGMDVHTISTCKYDDYYYGVDTVMEMLVDDTKEIAIAFDETYAGEEKLKEKVDEIEDDIKKGKMAHVKYYKSDNSDKNFLDKIPKLVIGMDVSTLEEITKLWYDSENDVSGSNEKIVNHPFRFIVLDQILIQLEEYMNHAKDVGQIEIASQFEVLLNFFQGINEDLSELRKTVMSKGDNQEIYDNDKILQFFKKYQAANQSLARLWEK